MNDTVAVILKIHQIVLNARGVVSRATLTVLSIMVSILSNN